MTESQALERIEGVLFVWASKRGVPLNEEIQDMMHSLESIHEIISYQRNHAED